MQDIRVALRHFRKSPGFAITVVLTIALGIGANTAIFTLVHAILMKSLPVGDPKTLYRVGDLDDCCVNGGFLNDKGDFDLFSYDLYKHLRDTTPEFERLAAMQSGSFTTTTRRGNEPARSERSEFVSGNYFTTFGIGSFAGRMLTDADDTAGVGSGRGLELPGLAVGLRRRPQHSRCNDLSAKQAPDRSRHSAARILWRPDQQRPPAIWVPLTMEPVIDGANANLNVPDSNWLYVIGRLKPGVNPQALQAKMSTSLRQWLSTQPSYTENGRSTIIPKQHVVITPGGAGIQNLQQETGKGLYLLMAISGLVLLVACANVANLLLARSATRKAETSIRMALGAARKRLVRQMLTESVLLACLGGLAGLAVAYAGTRTLLALAFPDSPNLPIQASPSLPVLGFAFLLSLVTGIVFGIVPAWITSHSDPAEALRGINRSTRDRASLPQKSLIVIQAALSLVLLIGAGLLTKSLNNMEHQNFGLQTANRYVLHLDVEGAGYTPGKLPALYQAIEDQFGSVPGVKSVGLALYSTLEGNNWGEGVHVEGRPAPGPNDDINSSWDRVSAKFFETVGQPVLRGRGFTEQDTATSQKVAVVNQSFVKRFFPKEDPIGRHFGVFDQKYAGTFEIVGIVADAKYNNPREEMRSMYFRPLNQQIPGLTDPNFIQAEGRSLYINSITLNFQTPPQDLDAMVRRTLANIDPNLTVIDLHSLDYQVAGNFTEERLISRLTALFGLLALVLASVGLYGITSYQVARRTSEIGLRMALGADRARVVQMVLRGAFIQVGLGLAIGIPVALLAARSMADQLYGVSIYDPLTLAAAVIVLAACAAVAGFVPARRAANIEPMLALRIE